MLGRAHVSRLKAGDMTAIGIVGGEGGEWVKEAGGNVDGKSGQTSLRFLGNCERICRRSFMERKCRVVVSLCQRLVESFI